MRIQTTAVTLHASNASRNHGPLSYDEAMHHCVRVEHFSDAVVVLSGFHTKTSGHFCGYYRDTGEGDHVCVLFVGGLPDDKSMKLATALVRCLDVGMHSHPFSGVLR